MRENIKINILRAEGIFISLNFYIFLIDFYSFVLYLRVLLCTLIEFRYGISNGVEYTSKERSCWIVRAQWARDSSFRSWSSPEPCSILLARRMTGCARWDAKRWIHTVCLNHSARPKSIVIHGESVYRILYDSAPPFPRRSFQKPGWNNDEHLRARHGLV